MMSVKNSICQQKCLTSPNGNWVWIFKFKNLVKFTIFFVKCRFSTKRRSQGYDQYYKEFESRLTQVRNGVDELVLEANSPGFKAPTGSIRQTEGKAKVTFKSGPDTPMDVESWIKNPDGSLERVTNEGGVDVRIHKTQDVEFEIKQYNSPWARPTADHEYFIHRSDYLTAANNPSSPLLLRVGMEPTKTMPYPYTGMGKGVIDPVHADKAHGAAFTEVRAFLDTAEKLPDLYKYQMHVKDLKGAAETLDMYEVARNVLPQMIDNFRSTFEAVLKDPASLKKIENSLQLVMEPAAKELQVAGQPVVMVQAGANNMGFKVYEFELNIGPGGAPIQMRAQVPSALFKDESAKLILQQIKNGLVEVETAAESYKKLGINGGFEALTAHFDEVKKIVNAAEDARVRAAYKPEDDPFNINNFFDATPKTKVGG